MERAAQEALLIAQRTESRMDMALEQSTLAISTAAAAAMTNNDYLKRAERDDKARAAAVVQMRTMLIIAGAAVLLALGGVVVVLQGQARGREQLENSLGRLQDKLVSGCLVRNESLLAQRQTYADFITTEQSDNSQPPVIQRTKILTYQHAIDLLPDPVDCSTYNR